MTFTFSVEGWPLVAFTGLLISAGFAFALIKFKK